LSFIEKRGEDDMKRPTIITLLTLLLILNHANHVSCNDITPIGFHSQLGEVISAQENDRYFIFGTIPGFTSGRAYRIDESSYKLHLMRNRNNAAQMIIAKMSSRAFTDLGNSIALRVRAMNQGERPFPTALFPVDSSDWIGGSETNRLILNDGSELLVNLERARNDTLIVTMLNGLQLDVPDDKILDLEETTVEKIEGTYYRTDPNRSRLLFAPTAHKLEAGSGYLADYFIFFPTIAYGITDFLSLSGGISLLPGAVSQLLYLAPKLTFSITPKFGVAAGFLYLGIPNETDDLTLGYAVVTSGDHRRSLTLGSGFSLTPDVNTGFILLVGGQTQISKNAKLISENWLFTGNETTLLFSGGVRFFGEKLAVDLALISSEEAFESDGFPFMPWVDFSYFFKR
jgi:hypothetical protein